MNLSFLRTLAVCLAVGWGGFGLANEITVESEAVLSLDAGDFASGRMPLESRIQSGDWRANASSKTLDAQPLPLTEARLDLGPEFVRQSLRVRAEATALSGKPIQSRYGVGLFGDKGYQAMLVPAHQKVQLLYRGEPLAEAFIAQQPEATFQIELTALYLKEQIYLQVRVVELKDDDEKADEEDGEMGSKPAIVFVHPHDQREMPLAGPACLMAAPFAGKPVQFSAVVLQKLQVTEGE